jgi:peptide deformylase
MTVHTVLKMGDPRLLRVAKPDTAFNGDSLHLLVSDLLDTMIAANGAGLAALQIGVDLQVVVFCSDEPNPRYPDAPRVPRTVLCNPVITPLGEEEQLGWEGCLSVPGLRGLVPRWQRIHAAPCAAGPSRGAGCFVVSAKAWTPARDTQDSQASSGGVP